MSCGGSKLYPDCSYCLKGDEKNPPVGCNGNCEEEESNGTCHLKGSYVFDNNEFGFCNSILYYEWVHIHWYSKTSDAFALKKHSVCVWAHTYDYYYHLALAKIACTQDIQCVAVIDKKCDNGGPFQLCKYGFVTPEKTVSSCIHKKKTYG